MRYRGRDFSEDEIRWIKDLISNDKLLNRAQLSRLICEELNWRRPDGRLKDMACRVALLQMERDTWITLPCAKHQFRVLKDQVSRTDLGKPSEDLICRAGDLLEIHLDLVQSPADKRLWAELVDRYHYLGHTPLRGAQLRYLIRSE